MKTSDYINKELSHEKNEDILYIQEISNSLLARFKIFCIYRK